MKSVHSSVREIAVLQEATEMILSSMDVDTVLHQILLIVRNYFGTANCAVFLVDPGTQELYCRAHNGYDDAIARKLRIKIAKEGVTGWVAQSKTPLYVPDVRKEPRYIAADAKAMSELALPLLVRDEVVGVLSIGSDKIDYFTDEMIGLLALFAGQAAVALENARLYSTERRRMRQIELINLIARAATAANNVDQLLTTLCDLIADTFEAPDVALLLREEEGPMSVRAYSGARTDCPESFPAAEESGIIAQALAARMNVVVNDVNAKPGWKACFGDAGSELCVPLVSFGETVGALVVSHKEAHHISTEDRSIAQAAADVSATAIRNVQLSDELRRVTNTDTLTGIYNQRYFHVILAQEVTRAHRYRKRFSVVMVDLKDFKEVNAKVGFDRGDQILRDVAQMLKKLMRNVDSICRYNGDRFVLVLPETETERMKTVLGKIADGVAQMGVSMQSESPAPPPLKAVCAFVSYPSDGATELDLVRTVLAKISALKNSPSS